MSSWDSNDTRKILYKDKVWFSSKESLSSNSSSSQTRITDFPLSKIGFGKSICVVGVGSAGCRAVAQISKESRMIENFLYVSSDEHDIAIVSNGKKLLVGQTVMKEERSPYSIRGNVHPRDLVAIKQYTRDSKVLIIVSGLGGAVGSALTPLIVKEIAEFCEETKIIAILIMPHSFETSKHFYAGCALGQIARVALGMILVDNDTLFLSSEIPSSLIDSHAAANQRIALVLNTLMASASVKGEKQEREIESNGIRRSLDGLINYFHENPCCLLNHSELRNAKIEDTPNGKGSNQEIVVSAENVSLAQTLDFKGPQERKSMDNLSFTLSSQLITFASVSETKFAKYDPIGELLGPRGMNLEDIPKTSADSMSLDVSFSVAGDQLANLDDIEALCSNVA
jgi:hypothetical protein